MSKTKSGAATQVTNSANDILTSERTDFPKFNQQIGNEANATDTQRQADYSPVATGYKQFADTGGFSDQDKTNYLNRATEGVANTYDVLGQQAKQAQLRTGGQSAPAAIAQIARQGSQAQSQALSDAQVNLNQQINSNKLAGIGGQAGLYNTDVQQQNAQNQLQLQGLGSYYGSQNSTLGDKAAAVPGYNSSVLSPVLDPVTQLAASATGVAKAFQQ